MTEVDISPDPEVTAVADEFFAEMAAGYGIEDKPADGLEARWAKTADLGFTLIGVPEALGGSGGSLQESIATLRAAAYHAVPLPVVENALAAWLLAGADRTVPAGPLSIAPGHADDALTARGGTATGVVHDVAWGRCAQRVIVLVGDELMIVDPNDCEITPGSDLAGQPRDVLALHDAPVDTVTSPVSHDSFFWRAALLRAAQISGTLEAVDHRTRRYTAERIQFGKPIATFQAVQQHIVTIAQAAQAATMAVWRAAAAVQRSEASFECCAAKLTANESARVAARATHQAHGAIGMTQEFSLHRLTRQLNTWRFDFGTERHLAEGLGRAVATAPSFAHCIVDQDNEVNVSCTI